MTESDATSEWDAEAAGWDGDEVVRLYANAAFASLESVLARAGMALSGAAVLDFGCGTGLLTEKLEPVCARVDGVDTSAGMLGVLKEKIARHGWTHVRALSALPAEGDAYDLVVCSSVCGFLEDYPGTVKALVGRMKPGGLLVQWDWEATPGEEDSYGLTREAIRDALAGAGLDVVVVETAFSVDVEGNAMRPLFGVGKKAG